MTGATGLVGGAVLASLAADGHHAVALSRRDRASTDSVTWVKGDPGEQGEWMQQVDGCDAVIHLAGESIAAKRWSPAQKRRLVDSRVKSTRFVVAAIASAAQRPSVLVSASAVGFYGTRGEEVLDEGSSAGQDFLADLCVQWEAEAVEAEDLGVRVVRLRIGIILSKTGGALEAMLTPFRFGLGSSIGPPKSWFPWVHVDDVVGLLRFALEEPIAGPVNAVSPEPARMGEFTSALGAALRRPVFLPFIPTALLRLPLGEFADHVSPGQRIRPARALEGGYRFQRPVLADALKACLE